MDGVAYPLRPLTQQCPGGHAFEHAAVQTVLLAFKASTVLPLTRIVPSFEFVAVEMTLAVVGLIAAGAMLGANADAGTACQRPRQLPRCVQANVRQLDALGRRVRIACGRGAAPTSFVVGSVLGASLAAQTSRSRQRPRSPTCAICCRGSLVAHRRADA